MVVRWYKTTKRGKELLKIAGLEGFELHADHIFPVSIFGTGIGLSHLANLYLMTKDEILWFNMRSDRWELKIQNIVSVRTT